MAKKTARKTRANARRGRNIRRIKEADTMEMNGGESAWRKFDGRRDYREILQEFISSPVVKYIAGGIATAVLTRIANNMAERYPEISNFIRENMEHLDQRLSGSHEDSIRH